METQREMMGRKSVILRLLALIMVSTWALVGLIFSSLQGDAPRQRHEVLAADVRAADSTDAETTTVKSNKWQWPNVLAESDLPEPQQLSPPQGNHPAPSRVDPTPSRDAREASPAPNESSPGDLPELSGLPQLPAPQGDHQQPIPVALTPSSDGREIGLAANEFSPGGVPELSRLPHPSPPQGDYRQPIPVALTTDGDGHEVGSAPYEFSRGGVLQSVPQAPLPSSGAYDQRSWWGAAAAANPQTVYALSSASNEPAPSGSYELIPPPPLPLGNRDNPERLGDGTVADNGAGSAVDYVDDAYGSIGALQVISGGPTYPWVGPGPHRLAARFGWWGVSSNGDPTKVAEYQSVRASAFVDLDKLWTDGLRTIDFSKTLLGAEASQVGMRYFSPGFSTRFFWQEFPHRLVRNPLSGLTPFDDQPPDPLPPPPNNFRVIKEELDIGEDHAIRVQQLEGGFKGKLANNVNWRLNVWSMRKKGDRQVTAMAHCFTASNATDSAGNPVTGVSCHVLSQGQSIDWVTTEIQPVVEARLGRATVEYERTMRIFSQNDELSTRAYDEFGFVGDLPYAVVPENYTAIDKLRIGLDLPDRSDAYVSLYTGNTENKLRDTNRRFHGFDLQVTDRSFDGVSITGYARQYVQTGQLPTILFAEESVGSIVAPINYERTSAGVKGRWRPYRGIHSWKSGFSLSGGYDYRRLDRENALFTEQVLSVDQSTTITNSLRMRASMRWSPQLDSYVRYRLAFVDDPLFGVPVRNAATNTSLPTQEHLVEIGNTWMPMESFLFSTTIGVNNAWNSSDVADFQEASYPLTFTAWYAPTPRWAISGGLAFFSNWIDQDITLGSKSNPATYRGNYGGQSDVVNLGTTFAKTERLTLSTSYEFVRGRNTFDLPGMFADIGPLSDVIVQINRFSAGTDYALRPNIDCYFRYQYFDYDDRTLNVTSGTANWFLGGVSAVF